MKVTIITPEERTRAFALPKVKKPETIGAQKLSVRYVVEKPETEGRPRRFLEIFAAILKHTNYRFVLDHYIRVSAKCSRCATACQVYLATGDDRDIPCHRSELLLSVYRRHFTMSGILRGRLTSDPGLTDEKIQEMAESFYNCTACRRCSLECPVGIDHGLVTHLGRYILSEMGIVPRALAVSVHEQLEGASGNTSGITLPALKDSLEFLTDDMEEARGVRIEFPLDVENADYIFYAPVSDYMMEADTLMGIAAVMHATGGSWTIGTKNFDGINYGLFYNDQILENVLLRLEQEANRLQAKGILIGECGHASRVAKFFYPTFCGARSPRPVVNIMEYTWQALKDGRLKLDPNVISETVTYHDPCNYARSGWIIDKPREIVKAFCKNYVEMTPSGKDNICCGGGGGTVSIDEVRAYRTTVGGRAKAEQIRATGAKYVIAPCANCKKQLRELVEDQKLDCEIVGLHDLIWKAIVFPETDTTAKTGTDAE
ncbi:MAG: (Fe-S)-binding protein [Myxococcales bacterium]|nr:MAG: (Fe-S)-binding protein [Myxococcales bacterium]